MMFNIPKVDIGIKHPIISIEPKKRPNRLIRRRNIYGKRGQRKLREWGLFQ